MVRTFISGTHIALFSFALVNALVAQSPAPDAAIDVPTRTLTNSNFQVVWNTGARDSEAITKLNWMGGSNMTGALNVDAVCGDGNVAYFGNSLAPPDPGAGGLVLGVEARSRLLEQLRGPRRLPFQRLR